MDRSFHTTKGGAGRGDPSPGGGAPCSQVTPPGVFAAQEKLVAQTASQLRLWKVNLLKLLINDTQQWNSTTARHLVAATGNKNNQNQQTRFGSKRSVCFSSHVCRFKWNTHPWESTSQTGNLTLLWCHTYTHTNTHSVRQASLAAAH